MRTSAPGVGPFVQILAISLLNATAVYAIRPMVSYRALQLGAGPLELGLIASSYAVLSLFAAFLIGRWTDRLGPRRFMVTGASLLAISALSAIGFGSIIGLAVGQALLGLGQIMNLVSAQTIVANQTARDRRDERFGLYTMVASGGQMIGPASAGLIAGGILQSGKESTVSVVPVFVFAASLAMMAVALSAYVGVPTRGAQAKDQDMSSAGHLSAARTVLARPSIPQAMLASVGVILSVDLLIAYLPAFGEMHAMPVELIGLLLATRAGGSMISRLFIGRLIRHIGRARALTGSMLLSGAAIAALPFLTHPAMLIGLMLVLGLGLGLGQPITIAWIVNRVPREQRGTAIGVRLTGNRLGLLVLPALMGSLAGTAGLAAMFWVLAALLSAASLMVWRAQFDDPPIARIQQR